MRSFMMIYVLCYLKDILECPTDLIIRVLSQIVIFPGIDDFTRIFMIFDHDYWRIFLIFKQKNPFDPI